MRSLNTRKAEGRCPDATAGDRTAMSDDSFKTRKTLTVGKQTVRLLQPSGRRAGRGRRGQPLADVVEDPARESAAIRRRQHRAQGRHQGAGQLGRYAAAGRRDRLSTGARADAGFHRRSRRCRPRGDAQRGRGGRTRSEDHQSAVAGRSRHRPLRDGRQVRHQQGVRRKRRHRNGAQSRALSVPALGPDRIRQLPRRAARHRHLSSGEPRIPREGRVDRRPRTAKPWRIPTRWSAPTATPR